MPDRPLQEIETRHLWYQVQYSRAAQDAHEGVRQKDADRLVDAKARVSAVTIAAASALLHLGQDAPRRRTRKLHWPIGGGARKRRRLTEFLSEMVEPSALVLLAGLEMDRPTPRRPRTLATRQELLAALQKGDFDSKALVAYVRRDETPSYRTAYNLACYYAGLLLHKGKEGAESNVLEQHAQDALRFLRLALRESPVDEQASLAEWAREDPSLSQLRQRRKVEFADIVDDFGKTPLPHRHKKPRKR